MQKKLHSDEMALQYDELKNHYRIPKIHSEIIKVIPNNTKIKKQQLKCGSCCNNEHIKSNK